MKGVDTIDISGTVRGTLITFSGVTVVQVSRAFYDRHIHLSSWLLRGPGWDFNFIPKGSLVQVALHHEALPRRQRNCAPRSKRAGMPSATFHPPPQAYRRPASAIRKSHLAETLPQPRR